MLHKFTPPSSAGGWSRCHFQCVPWFFEFTRPPKKWDIRYHARKTCWQKVCCNLTWRLGRTVSKEYRNHRATNSINLDIFWLGLTMLTAQVSEPWRSGCKCTWRLYHQWGEVSWTGTVMSWKSIFHPDHVHPWATSGLCDFTRRGVRALHARCGLGQWAGAP